jgi:transcriptional regulator with XRE-family HTH domain
MKLKRKIIQQDVAKLAGVNQAAVSRILSQPKTAPFAKETIERVFKAARELGYLHPSLVSIERRASARKKLGARARLAVLVDGFIYDQGEAKIDKISLSGLLLKNIRLDKNHLPLKHLSMDIEVLDQKLKGMRCLGRIARFADNEREFAIAIKYEKLDDFWREKIRRLVKK